MKIFITISLVFISLCACAQYPARLQVNISDESVIDLPDYLSKKEVVLKNKIELKKTLNDLLQKLYKDGFLTASVDSLKIDTGNIIAHLYVGDAYRWAQIKPGNADEGILTLAGFREKIYAGEPIHPLQFERLNKNILTYLENNGYPFSSVQLDSIEIKDNHISAKLNVTKNILVDIDSIIIIGDAKINPAYLYNYIGIEPGDLYNESLIRLIPVRIKELPFVTSKHINEVIFTENNTKIILYLDRKKASTGEGLLGILPDNEKAGKILVTGDMRLRLLNSFGKGELLDLNIKKLQAQTSELKANLVYPFLFSTRFGFDGKFNLYNRDTSFLSVNRSAGLQYILSGANYFKVFVNKKDVSPNSQTGFETLNRLPDYADITTTLYGVGIKQEKLDYRLNPRKGYSINFSGAGGNRRIRKNPKVNDALYDTISLKTVQYDLSLLTDIFIPIKSRSAFHFSTNSAYLYSPNAFENELFRFGGFRSLRGFDEESIFASFYSITTLEWRYLLEQNSYAYVFWNGAYYENKQLYKAVYDTPYGFGAGVSFETKAGIFSMNYALGRQQGNPILLRAGKVHFGITSFF